MADERQAYAAPPMIAPPLTDFRAKVARVAGYLRCVLRTEGGGYRTVTLGEVFAIHSTDELGEPSRRGAEAAEVRDRERTGARLVAAPAHLRCRRPCSGERSRDRAAARSNACPTARCGASTSSSGRRTASARSRSAWWPASCAAAGELRLWADELGLRAAAVPTRAEQALFVAYYAIAELGCFLALGWPMPARILDLFAEFRVATNGASRRARAARACSGALVWHGLDAMAADEKDEMRALAMRGGPYTADERAALLDYCAADVDALAALLPAMLPGSWAASATRRGARPRPAAGPLHGRGRPHGADRHPDRRPAARTGLRAAWEGIKARAGRRGRRALRRLRRAQLQGGPVRRLPRAQRHPLAAARRAGRWRWTTTRSATWPRLTRSSSRCASCATRSASCG